jgi:hypothetical protein
MATATPTNTAYCSGTSSVAAKVISMAEAAMGPVFHTVTPRWICRLCAPITISSPESAARGMLSTRLAKSRTIRPTKTPPRRFAQRERAPTLTLIAVAPMDPPAGMPPKKLVAALATPWPKKSRETLGYLPSGLG